MTFLTRAANSSIFRINAKYPPIILRHHQVKTFWKNQVEAVRKTFHRQPYKNVEQERKFDFKLNNTHEVLFPYGRTKWQVDSSNLRILLSRVHVNLPPFPPLPFPPLPPKTTIQSSNKKFKKSSFPSLFLCFLPYPFLPAPGAFVYFRFKNKINCPLAEEQAQQMCESERVRPRERPEDRSTISKCWLKALQMRFAERSYSPM